MGAAEFERQLLVGRARRPPHGGRPRLPLCAAARGQRRLAARGRRTRRLQRRGGRRVPGRRRAGQQFAGARGARRRRPRSRRAVARPSVPHDRARPAAAQRLGRTLGYPTANLALHRESCRCGASSPCASAAPGVEDHPAVVSLGTRPTVNGTEPLLEVHLFDFDGDLYGQYLSVDFVRWLREERKFDVARRAGRADARRCGPGARGAGRPGARLSRPVRPQGWIKSHELPHYFRFRARSPTSRPAMADYKNTVNLPETDFPMKADLARREPEMLAWWERAPDLREAARGRRGPPHVHPARRSAVRERRDPHRPRRQQDPEGHHRQVAHARRLRRALRAGLGLPRPADRAPGREDARPRGEEARRQGVPPGLPRVRAGAGRRAAPGLHAPRRAWATGSTRT